MRWIKADSEQITDPVTAVEYAKKIGKRVDDSIEDVIIKDGFYSYIYAKDVLKARFPKGEKAILDSRPLLWAIYYAREIIRGRWSELEDIIIERGLSEDALEYTTNIIKGRWIEGEDIIAKNGWASLQYAQLIKRRFQKGEKAIWNDRSNKKQYLELLKEWGDDKDFVEKEMETESDSVTKEVLPKIIKQIKKGTVNSDENSMAYEIVRLYADTLGDHIVSYEDEDGQETDEDDNMGYEVCSYKDGDVKLIGAAHGQTVYTAEYKKSEIPKIIEWINKNWEDKLKEETYQYS